ncbi:MAG: hypothetical protein CFE33_08555 [Pseudorhodobacter sp. PARRP1]|nr:MAG: hypothetical protein CFE33_08555 [Pseudorhodobacter sp. PARRP1]
MASCRKLPQVATRKPAITLQIGLGLRAQKRMMLQGQPDGRNIEEYQMAKGMSKPGKNVKKPKKEKAKPAMATPSTKNSVVINTNGPKD